MKKFQKKLICAFAVLGHPTPSLCKKRLDAYIASPIDMLELGIPFSDPVADGPVIQNADEQAISAGTTMHTCIDMVAYARKKTQIPIGILAYANSIYQYGIEKCYRDLKKAGATSILIADLPLEEIEPFADAAKKYDLQQIIIVSENTTTQRLKKITKIARGFLYVVSSMGVTGEQKRLNSRLAALLKRLKKHTSLPLMVGFGISHPRHATLLKKTAADGIIIGSALVKRKNEAVKPFLTSMCTALNA